MAEESVVECTAVDADWGDNPPNALMHPPCFCPRCQPDTVALARRDSEWLQLPGNRQRQRVARAKLGEFGRASLG